MSLLLVYEQQPLNAALFARACDGLKLNEVRSLTQLTSALDQVQPAVACLQVELAELIEVASIVRQIKRDTQNRCLVIGMPVQPVRAYAVPLYAAGVDMLFWSMLHRDRAVRLIRRRVTLAATAVEKDESLRSGVWSRLPWKRHRTGGGSSSEK